MGLLDYETLGSGLNELGGKKGVGAYGARHDSIGVKGKGWFGPMKGAEGISTEISSANNSFDFPLMVPTLSKGELDHLLGGNEPTDEIYEKAIRFAEQQRQSGQSPFYSGQGLYYPTPKW